MTIANQDIITLKNHKSELRVLPKLGGSILSFLFEGNPVFREVDESTFFDAPTVRLTACYPLVPFSNRIAEAKFNWNDKAYSLRKNFGDSPHALHGLGWQSEWQIDSIKDDEVTLSLNHIPKMEGDWPFAFFAIQQFKLIENALHLSLSVENKSDESMPCGLGWHPFFKRTAQTCCDFNASKLWQNDENMLPTQSIPLEKSLYQALFQPLGEKPTLDNCLSGFEGTFCLRQPDLYRQIDIQASSLLNHLVIFTPPTGSFIAVEPISHRNAAVNSEDPIGHGLVDLAVNSTMNVTCTMTITHLNPIS